MRRAIAVGAAGAAVAGLGAAGLRRLLRPGAGMAVLQSRGG
ncbi:MAG: hypothetical protein QOG45_2668, partial [Chloroflexota bacterium]|nr:hypothetical protein [Chloroflexota bacterium]